MMMSKMEMKLDTGKQACIELIKYAKETVLSQRDFIKSYSKVGSALNDKFYSG